MADAALIDVAADLRRFGETSKVKLREAVNLLGEGLDALDRWGEYQPQFHHIERDLRKLRDAHASLKRLISEKTDA